MIIKMLTEQVFNQRPALERPIAHMKYGLLGALAAGLITAVAMVVLGGALYFWLLSVGTGNAGALLTVGAALILVAAGVWVFCNMLLQKEILAQERAALEQERRSQVPQGDLTGLLMQMAQGAAAGFFDGLTEKLDHSERPQAADTKRKTSHVNGEEQDALDPYPSVEEYEGPGRYKPH
ncbi:hypothetical protein ACFOKA_06055 [Kordiimonas pumila]|uniref:Phage holin family protein n=2 Tax=Kordiimonas pumila TaxID=2161677 RepID=A0ABV7D3R6_9PROT|nr:hypothetical protein [Kordiimonas pumila]